MNFNTIQNADSIQTSIFQCPDVNLRMIKFINDWRDLRFLVNNSLIQLNHVQFIGPTVAE